MKPALIGIDWGTTHARAYLLTAQGKLLEKDENLPGLSAIKKNGEFASTVSQMRHKWAMHLPVIMCGMVGSREGWKEIPYIACPANLFDIAHALVLVHENVWIVPGVRTSMLPGQNDVMRSEETQIIGALRISGRNGWYCLPGTCSKWVQVCNDHIIHLRTFMTGELFTLLKVHSLLGKVMHDVNDDAHAFILGVQRSMEQIALTHLLFGARVQALLGELAPSSISPYVSGLLIGYELKAMRSQLKDEAVTLVGRSSLCNAYRDALHCIGIPALCISGEEAATSGLLALAQAHQLV